MISICFESIWKVLKILWKFFWIHVHPHFLQHKRWLEATIVASDLAKNASMEKKKTAQAYGSCVLTGHTTKPLQLKPYNE
jgi:hypothetical protein